MVKKISFADDVKTHDGSLLSFNESMYCRIVFGFFNTSFEGKIYKVKDEVDILRMTSFDEETIEYCIMTFGKVIAKLLEKTSETEDNEHKIEDPYWDALRFHQATIKRKAKKVAILLKGSRDISCSIPVNSIEYAHKLMTILLKARKESSFNLDEWVVIGK